MLELVFLVCLKTQPMQCEERRLAYSISVDLAICAMNAPAYLAEWAVRHPAYSIGTWRCEAVMPGEDA